MLRGIIFSLMWFRVCFPPSVLGNAFLHTECLDKEWSFCLFMRDEAMFCFLTSGVDSISQVSLAFLPQTSVLCWPSESTISDRTSWLNSVLPIAFGINSSGGAKYPEELQRSPFFDSEQVFDVLCGNTERPFFSVSREHEFRQWLLARDLRDADREASVSETEARCKPSSSLDAASAGEIRRFQDAYCCLELRCPCKIKEMPRMGPANSVQNRMKSWNFQRNQCIVP